MKFLSSYRGPFTQLYNINNHLLGDVSDSVIHLFTSISSIYGIHIYPKADDG